MFAAAFRGPPRSGSGSRSHSSSSSASEEFHPQVEAIEVQQKEEGLTESNEVVRADGDGDGNKKELVEDKSMSSSSNNNDNQEQLDNNDTMAHDIFLSNATATISGSNWTEPSSSSMGGLSWNNSTTPALPTSQLTAMDEDTLSTMLSGFLPLLFLMTLCFCSANNRREDRSVYFRGHVMRRNFIERERRRLQSESRNEMSPAQRQKQIDTHFKTMTVVKKQWRRRNDNDDDAEDRVIEFVLESVKDDNDSDNEDHNCGAKAVLCNCDVEINKHNLDVSFESDHGDNDRAGDIENQLSSPDSPNCVEAFPSPDFDDKRAELTETEPYPPSAVDVEDNNENSDVCDDFEECDDEDVCHICLDAFDVGDRVMWAKHFYAGGTGGGGACRHVFHEDCIMPWLMEKRENECPSCRRCLIHDDTTTCDDNRGGDMENTNDQSTQQSSVSPAPSSLESVGSEAESTEERAGVMNGVVDPKSKPDTEEGIEVTLSSSRAMLQDEMDCQYRYIIVKGLIEKIPLNHDVNDCRCGDLEFDRYDLNHTTSTQTSTTVASGDDSDSSDDSDEQRSQSAHSRRGSNHAPTPLSRTDNLRLPSFDQRMDLVNSLVGASHQMGLLPTTVPLQRRRPQASFSPHDLEQPQLQQDDDDKDINKHDVQMSRHLPEEIFEHEKV